MIADETLLCSSKLTWVLKGMLGGHSNTRVLLTVSPNMEDMKYTADTLRFGTAVKAVEIKNPTPPQDRYRFAISSKRHVWNPLKPCLQPEECSHCVGCLCFRPAEGQGDTPDLLKYINVLSDISETLTVLQALVDSSGGGKSMPEVAQQMEQIQKLYNDRQEADREKQIAEKEIEQLRKEILKLTQEIHEMSGSDNPQGVLSKQMHLSILLERLGEKTTRVQECGTQAQESAAQLVSLLDSEAMTLPPESTEHLKAAVSKARDLSKNDLARITASVHTESQTEQDPMLGEELTAAIQPLVHLDQQHAGIVSNASVSEYLDLLHKVMEAGMKDQNMKGQVDILKRQIEVIRQEKEDMQKDYDSRINDLLESKEDAEKTIEDLEDRYLSGN